MCCYWIKYWTIISWSGSGIVVVASVFVSLCYLCRHLRCCILSLGRIFFRIRVQAWIVKSLPPVWHKLLLKLPMVLQYLRMIQYHWSILYLAIIFCVCHKLLHYVTVVTYLLYYRVFHCTEYHCKSGKMNQVRKHPSHKNYKTFPSVFWGFWTHDIMQR